MHRPSFFAIPAWLHEFLAEPFRRNLVLVLFLIGIGLVTYEQLNPSSLAPAHQQIAFFFHPQCPHCQQQKTFIPYLQTKYPQMVWTFYDTSKPENASLLFTSLQQRGRSERAVGVPVTFIGPYVIDGFDTPATTGVQLEQAIQAVLHNDPTLFTAADGDRLSRGVTLPLVGRLDLVGYSLPALAVILGLVDGFNPCAMWVLVYLISLIVNLGDRRKIWLLVGTFVLSSGILYFLFMTAWLNAFLFLGYLRPLTLIIGLTALGAGILQIREYLTTRGELVCAIGDARSRQRTMNRIDQVVSAPLTLFTVFSMIILAFVVNSIEFACSAGLPALFTHTLALRDLPLLQYYGYLLLYDLFFMLDDLIIFSLAVLALDTGLGQRYARHCRIVSGVVLIGLGAIMVVRPDLLR